jgi:PIN domain nuclease of toxin-antitoxin system
VILLDTHALLWLEFAAEKLSVAARAAIEFSDKAGEKLAVSAVSLWEIALLCQRKRITLLLPLEDFLRQVEEIYVIRPLTAEICIRGASLTPPFPKDPMDRLIAATALAENLTLITADRSILASNACKLLW